MTAMLPNGLHDVGTASWHQLGNPGQVDDCLQRLIIAGSKQFVQCDDAKVALHEPRGVRRGHIHGLCLVMVPCRKDEDTAKRQIIASNLGQYEVQP